MNIEKKKKAEECFFQWCRRNQQFPAGSSLSAAKRRFWFVLAVSHERRKGSGLAGFAFKRRNPERENANGILWQTERVFGLRWSAATLPLRSAARGRDGSFSLARLQEVAAAARLPPQVLRKKKHHISSHFSDFEAKQNKHMTGEWNVVPHVYRTST